MVNFIFLISNFYHSDVNRNLPRRRPIRNLPRRRPIRRRIPASPPSFPRTRESIFADKLPPSRRFFVEKRGKFAVLFLKMDSRFRGNDGFFCGIPPIPPRSREWNVLFPGRFAGNDGVFFAENAGFCSSKLLRLVSPPTNVRGLSVFVVFFADSDGRGDFFGQISAAAVYN